MSREIDGLDELKNKFDELENKADDLDGENEVKFDELFNPDFMKKYTNFISIDEMFEKSSFEVNSEEDFEEIPEEELDEYVNNNTKFSTWEEMLQKGVQEWTSNQLGL